MSVGQVVEYSGFRQMVMTFPKRKPFLTNVGLSLVVSVAGDCCAQKAEGKKTIDWRRVGLFASWGTISFGAISWLTYITIFSRVCPHAIRFSNLSWKQKMQDRRGQADLLKQVVLDLAVYVPLVSFPFMYVFKSWVANPTSEPSQVLVQGLATCRQNFWEDNAVSLIFWIPGDLVVFAVPAWMRMVTNNFMVFLWAGILSHMRGFKD
jgi:hypothetical protein